MTSNQVAYWNLQETKRSNRSNERIKEDTLGEAVRHNKATERDADQDRTLKAMKMGSDTVNNLLGIGGKIVTAGIGASKRR